MPSLTAKEREDFLRQDRERLEAIRVLPSNRSLSYYDKKTKPRGIGGGGPLKNYSINEGESEDNGVWADSTTNYGIDNIHVVKDEEGKETEGDDGDLFESEREPVTLPESTHTLFFTQPVCSIPFGFASAIVVISISCLVMAFTDNVGLVMKISKSGFDRSRVNPYDLPANISLSARIAQYLGILIALLMEEEIPTGAYLLRSIPSSSFAEKFPNKSYKRFVASALLRVFLGYIFLFNVLVILIKATAVLEIFYDVLALQFISELDDIAFSLSKLDILGKSLRKACTAKLFRSEFERPKFSARSIKSILFLKSVYFVNLVAFLSIMIVVSMNQISGKFQCDGIKVDFGDAVWGDAWVVEEGVYEERVLAFSTFNGIYVKSGTEHGRPIYQERRKFDREEYEDYSMKIPAEIKYSIDLGSWIFVHPKIAKKKQGEPGTWLLRSPETKEYDLLYVEGEWNIWFGLIDTTHLTYSCTECNDDTDCNLNGECSVDGECKCYVEEETSYLGPHCEVKLKDKCNTIVADSMNSTWSIYRFSQGPGLPADTLFEEYNRPIYVNVEGLPTEEGHFNWLLYTGSRWRYYGGNYLALNFTEKDIGFFVMNYHAFWDGAFSPNPYDDFIIISDPTNEDSPVGVDWFQVTAWGDQFGPFGALTPLQEDGMGVFRCAGENISEGK